MEALGVAFGVLAVLVVLAVGIGGLVLWVMALIECATTPDHAYRMAGSDKTTWVLVVALAGWIGALIYWFTIRGRLRDIDPGRTGAGGVPPTPPGWYPDPHAPGRLRWWDGTRWTEHMS